MVTWRQASLGRRRQDLRLQPFILLLTVPWPVRSSSHATGPFSAAEAASSLQIARPVGEASRAQLTASSALRTGLCMYNVISGHSSEGLAMLLYQMPLLQNRTRNWRSVPLLPGSCFKGAATCHLILSDLFLSTLGLFMGPLHPQLLSDNILSVCPSPCVPFL